ncbi:carbon storage regulator [Rickettsiales endosymbiont of Stachyamoeba lipophora]|uniref:carbon storage regulator n=1 Tax=Rickettsiales endosymbiont of Stachyamoeba lipophora TaxID=2486578 RepID=UPI000F649103|nr:carbon storage regulator [Rickettsiales endosymbiont of Stachyamoeba lipophora]AZL15304.1 carbon storage regulator [Rickettsiales endosymbiont of Stachyamoeba lipophora]
MLYITRKKNQKVFINNEIEVSIIDVGGGKVILGFKCPLHHTVLRGEIYERIAAENQNAANAELQKNPKE